MFGEPLHALDVEVVGGLVEHQQVQFLDQGRGQRNASSLTAGETVDGRGEAEIVDADAGEDVADPRVAGPLVIGDPERSEHHLADRGSFGEDTALGDDGHPQSPDPAHPARVRLLDPRQHLEQGGLATAVESDDADALAFVHAEGHRVEQRLDAERLRHLLEIDQIRHQRDPFESTSITRAPGTGPLATRPVRHTPAPESSALTDSAASASAHRKAQVGPEPETMPASAPAVTPARRVRRSCGASDSAAACRSLPSNGASAAASPVASACSRGSASPTRGGAPAARRRSSSRYTAGVLSPPFASASTQWKVLRESTGSSFSPRPVPKAVPPCRENGTSLPSRAARWSSSSRPRRSCHNVSSATSVAAASALPPAMPPATGMPLTMVISTSGARPASAASSVAACHTRLRSSVGTDRASSPRTRTDNSSAGTTRTSSPSESAWNTVLSSW